METPGAVVREFYRLSHVVTLEEKEPIWLLLKEEDPVRTPFIVPVSGADLLLPKNGIFLNLKSHHNERTICPASLLGLLMRVRGSSGRPSPSCRPPPAPSTGEVMTSASPLRNQQEEANNGSSSPSSWSCLKSAVRESRRSLSGSAASLVRAPANFVFRSMGEVMRTRIYFLSSSSAAKESTLLYVDVDDSSPSAAASEAQLTWNPLLETSFQVKTISFNHSVIT